MFKENIYNIIGFGLGQLFFVEFLSSSIKHVIFTVVWFTNHLFPIRFALIKFKDFNYSIFIDSTTVFGFLVNVEVNNWTFRQRVKVSNFLIIYNCLNSLFTCFNVYH